jgi:hypothetical protein
MEVIKMNYLKEKAGQAAIATIAIATLVFLIVLVVYGEVSTALNFAVFSTAVQSLINLLPLILVGGAIIGIVVVVFRLTQ